MASIPTHGSGSKSAHRTLEASARHAVSAVSSSRPSVGHKKIVSGGSPRSMSSQHGVSKDPIHGPDKGEG